MAAPSALVLASTIDSVDGKEDRTASAPRAIRRRVRLKAQRVTSLRKRLPRSSVVSRQHLQRVLAHANCLLWQSFVRAIYPPGWTPYNFDPVHDAVLDWDLTIVNDSLLETPSWLPVAREQGENIRDAWMRSRDPQDEITADTIVRQALFTGKSRYTQIYRNRMADGSIRWMSEDVCIENLPDPTASAPGVTGDFRHWWLTGVVTDITEQLAAEEKQRALSEQLRQITEKANCLLWQAEVFEVYPIPGGEAELAALFPGHNPGNRYRSSTDALRGTAIVWRNLEVINEREVLSWLPILIEDGETFSSAWNKVRQPDDFRASVTLSFTSLITGKDRYTQSFRTRVQDGTYRWLQEDVRIDALEPGEDRCPSGEKLRRWRLTGVVTDITEQKRAEERQAETANDLRQVTEQANCVLWRADVREVPLLPDAVSPVFDAGHQTTLDWSVALVNTTKLPIWLPIQRQAGETLTQAWYRARHPLDKETGDANSWSCLRENREHYTQVFRNKMPDGTVRWLQEDVRVEKRESLEPPFADGIAPGRWTLTGVVTDITDRKLTEEALWWRANHDSLTGLYNRHWIHERISADLAGTASLIDTQRSDLSGAVFILDMDGFKYVNDSLGHNAGDRFIQAAAHRLEETLAKEFAPSEHFPNVARLGGDEFLIWLPRIILCAGSAPPQETIERIVGRLAEKLLQTISHPMRFDFPTLKPREVLMTASIGIALYPADGADTETLLKNADTALYQAKAAGRGKYRFYKREQSDLVSNRLVMETRLRQAVRDEDLTLCYQPQFDAQNHQIVGVEALLRWQDAELGAVSPTVFIPLAEELGLIHALGEYALRHACHQLSEWRRHWNPTLRMSVNLSALQLVETELLPVVLSALENAGLPGNSLELEITETALIRSGEQGPAYFLREIRRQGIRLAIDDFGTGYSSLSYLRNMPVDVVKIDRGFIREIVDNEQTRAIVKAIIDLSHALGLSVTAEGVETERQRQTLSGLSCNVLQGYWFSQAVTAQEIATLLHSQVDSGSRPLTTR